MQDTKTAAEYLYGERMGHRVCLAARKREVMLRPLGNVVVLMPPLAMTEPQLGELGAITAEAIRRATARLGRLAGGSAAER